MGASAACSGRRTRKRYPFELDAGLGELPRRKDGVRSKTLKYITVKPVNVHPLTSLDDELVRAVHNAGGQGLLNLSAVVLPRRHSCFLREMHASDMLERGLGGARRCPSACGTSTWSR